MTNPNLFGTDGIRGKVGGEVITPENILKLGWAIGTTISQEAPNQMVLIGKDTRISGYMIESALQAGLAASGVNIGLLGPMPTPAIAYLTKTLRASAGIVISASHNLFMDNGIKVFDANGNKINDNITNTIMNNFHNKLQVTQSNLIGRAKRYNSAPARYIERCKSKFESQSGSLNGLHIVLDCANGANYMIAPCVFTELGATVTTLNDQPNGFNINKECGSLHPRQLAQQVLQKKADCGIAFDGDGDRVVMVDHTGQICDGDQLLYIIASYQHRKQLLKGGIVGTQMTNGALIEAFKQLKIPFERVKVGDRHIMQRLLKNNWQLGGEPSGHIIDLKNTTTGDGIIAALLVLTAMIEQDSSLASLTAALPKYPQALINLQRSNQLVYDTIKPKVNKLEKLYLEKLSSNGRILIRPSGTESIIRVLVEDHDPILVEKISKALTEELKSIVNT